MKMTFKFYNNFFLTISNLSGHYVVAGDFNCTLEPSRDRSLGVDNTHTRLRKTWYNPL